MANHNNLKINGYWIIHPAGKVISSIYYQTDINGMDLGEKILREEFGLVEERNFDSKTKLTYPKYGLVYEKKGIGIYHVHLIKDETPNFYFHYWVDKMSFDDFKQDPMRKTLQRIYEAINPAKVTGPLSLRLKEKLPWQK